VVGEEDGRLKQIMSQVVCDNDFRCRKAGSENHCRAKIIGDGRLVDCSNCGPGKCLRADPKNCNYRMSFGFGNFCTCLVRIFFAQHPG
jgi:hypothetical protein